MTSLLLTLVMLLSLVPAMGVTASAAASGDGTTEWNPFVVTTYEDLKEKMELTGNKYIQLGADIDTSTMNSGFGLGSTDFVSAIGRSYLDLNGKKLTLKKSIIESGGEIQFIRVTAGELIIKDSVGGGEIVGVNKVMKRYMRLIDVLDGAKLTLNSGKLHLELNADADLANATIWSTGTVEINGGTVAISCPNTWDERGSDLYNQDYALSSSGKAVINGGTLDGRVLLAVVAKASGVADNVITGGDFKKSIYIHKDKDVTGNVPLNVSIQGGTYRYTPGYYTHPVDAPAYPGKKSSDPSELFQFATGDFREKDVPHDGAVYPAFPGESSNSNYDMNAFASMFHKNAIITAAGQEYDYYDVREDEPMHIVVNDAAFTGSSSALDLAHLVNSHYKTVTVTTLPSDALTGMKLTVGSDGTPLPAQGNSTVSGDVTLGSGGTLTKTVYITARGNKQLKEMYYSNPSKIDFRYGLNILKGKDSVDYTGVISQTYAAVGDEISVSVQLPNFKFEEGVYTFRLALWPYLRGSEAQIGETLVGRWKLTAKKHEHNFGPWKIAGTGNVHFRECSCGVQESKPHEWKYLEGQDKYKCNVCGYEIDGAKDRITHVYASPRSPIAGEHPGNYTAAEWVKIVGANYKVESIVWKNMNDTDVTTFESGKIYKGTVTFKADPGFAFDGDRIYGSQIFDSSKAVIVDDYTLAEQGTILTATFKLKDNTVKPGLNVKVKLPTLNDKIGQNLPAAELVDTALPENVNVKFMYNVYENNISKEVTDVPDYKVKPNQKYFYMVWLQPEDIAEDDLEAITKTYNVSYTVTDGGDAETYADYAGYAVLATYQTPDTSEINVSVSGKVVSYNGKIDFTVTLYETGTTTEKGKVTVTGTGASGQASQDFTLTAVAPGTYDLVVTKPGHLTYTITGVVVGTGNVDLTVDTSKAYSTITLLAGDVNGDRKINATDLGILKSNFMKVGSNISNQLADINGDSKVNATDLGILKSNFMKTENHCKISF